MAGISIGSVPERCRNSRSFRQWAEVLAISRVRTFRPAGLRLHCIPKACATGSSAACSSAWGAAVVASTRMKKVPVPWLPYCWESVILQPATSRAPATACTMPGRSGQERVRM